jgi:uncharacterized LabA/DUF88 family protein
MVRRLESGARVLVFIDGQNVLQEARRLYGYGFGHPLVLAQSVLDGRTLQGVRYYSGIHLPRKRPDLHAASERRHALMRKVGVTVVTRPLRYRWEWGFDPDLVPDPYENRGKQETVNVEPYERPREKGIDLSLALDVVDLALDGMMDVAVIVSSDNDLTEAARVVHEMTGRAGGSRVSVEAAVFNEERTSVMLKHYDYTHQLRYQDFDNARDSFDYRQPLNATMEQAFIMSCGTLRPSAT